MTVTFAAALAIAAAQPVTVTDSRIPYVAPPPDCDVRPALADTELMLVSLHEGETLSSAWVGDPNEPTFVIPFSVAPGGSIHLIITGYAQNVYQFSGAVGRIRRLTVMGHGAAAVTGLPAAIMEFTPACLPYGLFRTKGGPGVEAVRRYFGRTPDNIAHDYSPFRIRIDTELHADRPPPPGPRPGTGENETDRLYQFSPGGIADMNPDQLVSAAPKGAYRTLPQVAGIRQLVRAGALVPATEADVRAWQAQARRQGATGEEARGAYMRNAYRVTRPIIVPSGLCGALSIELFLPTPAYVIGNPCHSTLYLADGTSRGPR